MQADATHTTQLHTPDEKPLTSPPGDLQLWLEFKGGCQAAFSLIYKNHFFNLYQYGIHRGYARETVKDCIQDLFVELWKYRQNLKPTDSIAYYLLKSLSNKLSNCVPAGPVTNTDGLSLKVLSIEDSLIEEQTLTQHKKKVLDALSLLTRRQHQAIRLKFFQGLKNEEIAENMSISVPAVYNLVSKALMALKENLGKAYLLLLFGLFL